MPELGGNGCQLSRYAPRAQSKRELGAMKLENILAW
jgi:hypothetical protein